MPSITPDSATSLKLPRLPEGCNFLRDKEIPALDKLKDPSGQIVEVVGDPCSPHEFTLKLFNVPIEAMRSGLSSDNILYFSRDNENLLSWINLNYQYHIQLIDGNLVLSKIR